MRMLGLPEMLAVFCLFSLAAAVWAWALSICLTGERDPQRRLFWVLLLGLTHVLGAAAYLAARALRVRSSRGRSIADEDTAVG